MVTKNAQDLLERKYYTSDEENFKELANRVASFIANNPHERNDFFDILVDLDFLPNSPVLMNADEELGYLSACNVLPIEDDMDDIFNTLKESALIQKNGGGVGFSFSRLRPKGDKVGSTGRYSSGVVSFMKAYDSATDTIKQGGKRRGACMGVLKVDHPDIMNFINAKGELDENNQEIFDKMKKFLTNEQKEYFKSVLTDTQLSNFNISIAITNEFMEAVKNRNDYHLYNPRTNKITGTLHAPEVWNEIIEMAHTNGSCGLFFIDKVNDDHPAPEWIESPNVCGEEPLLPYESCILGAINLANMIYKRGNEYYIDWNKLNKTVRIATRFLDNTIDKNKYPLEKVEKATKKYRKIGVGVMGWAEMLIKLGMRYGEQPSLDLAEKLSEYIKDTAIDESEKLAKEKGIPDAIKELGLNRRNLAVNTVAPTGSRSIIAGTSGGIEPFFDFKYTHTDAEGNVSKFEYDFVDEIDNEDVLVTAMDIIPERHVAMQSAWQKHIQAGVSKTINLPNDATKEDIDKIYELAYETECKGITVYRYGSKTEQVLNKDDEDDKKESKTIEDELKKELNEKDTEEILKEDVPKEKQNVEQLANLIGDMVFGEDGYKVEKEEKTNNQDDEIPRGYVKDAELEADSTRYKCKSGCGTAYNTIVNDDEKIIETFIETKNGGCKASTEAMSRLISLCLRGGISVDEVIDQLHSVSPCIAYVNQDGTDKGTSCPDMIGHKLKREKQKLEKENNNRKKQSNKNIKISNTKTNKNSIESSINEKDKCPECGAELRNSSGCRMCPNCGYSKCS